MAEGDVLDPVKVRVKEILQTQGISEQFDKHIDLIANTLTGIQDFDSLKWQGKVRWRLLQSFPGPENKGLRISLYRIISNLHGGLRGMENVGIGRGTEADSWLGSIRSTGAREKGER